jgi:hypothetical protein
VRDEYLGAAGVTSATMAIAPDSMWGGARRAAPAGFASAGPRTGPPAARKDPDHALAGDRLDECLYATLELTDVDRAGVDLRSGRLEDDRALVDAIERGPRQCSLPNAVLADQEDRSRGALFERGHDDLYELSSPSCQERGRVVERPPPDPPDVPEVRKRSPRLEARAKVGPEFAFELVDERLEPVCRLERELVERLDTYSLAACDPFTDELRDELILERPESLQRGADHRLLGMNGESPQKEAVLAHGGANRVCAPPKRASRQERRHAPRERRVPSTRPNRRCRGSVQRPLRRRRQVRQVRRRRA